MTWCRFREPDCGDERSQRNPAEPRQVEGRKASCIKKSTKDCSQPRPKLGDFFHQMISTNPSALHSRTTLRLRTHSPFTRRCRFQIEDWEGLNALLYHSVSPGEIEELLILSWSHSKEKSGMFFASLNMTFTLPVATQHPSAAKSRHPQVVFQQRP